MIKKMLLAGLFFSMVSGSECPSDSIDDPINPTIDYDDPSDPDNGYPQAEVIRGQISDDKQLDENKVYRLVGRVSVEDGAILSIPAGTLIVGDFKSKGHLVVLRGGKLMARGTKEDPIVFTSSRRTGKRKRGDWGGIVLNGKAPNNGSGGELIGEGNTGVHGGTDPMDNSGVLTYVRSEFGGISISADNEINSFTFNSVGAGTQLEYLQAHYGDDDGFEWFGGTVNAKYLVSSGNEDDSFDSDRSWIGKGQFWLAVQAKDAGKRGYESSNDGAGSDAMSSLGFKTRPIVYNATLIGRQTVGASAEPQGIYAKDNAQGEYYNHVVANWKDGFFVSDETSRGNFDSDDLFVKNSIFWVTRNTTLGNDTIGQVFKGPDDGSQTRYDIYKAKSSDWKNSKADPSFRSFNYTDLIDDTRTPDFRVGSGVDITTDAATPTDPAPRYTGESQDFFDKSATYIGAFSSDNNWINGWTTWSTK